MCRTTPAPVRNVTEYGSTSETLGRLRTSGDWSAGPSARKSSGARPLATNAPLRSKANTTAVTRLTAAPPAGFFTRPDTVSVVPWRWYRIDSSSSGEGAFAAAGALSATRDDTNTPPAMSSSITAPAASLITGRPRSPSVVRSNTDPTATPARRGISGEGGAIAAERAAIRARARSRSSRPTRHDSAPKPAAAASDRVVSVRSTTSILIYSVWGRPARLRASRYGGAGLYDLPQRELDGHFDEDVHGNPFPHGRGKSPLLHRADRALLQAVTEALQHVRVADAAVAPHDDLHQHVSRDAAAARLFGIGRFHLAQQAWRFDAAARAVWSAAGAAAFAVAYARPEPFAVARPLARPDAAVCARSVAVGPFDRVLDGALAIAIVGRDGFNGRDDHLRGRRLGSRFRRRRLTDWWNRGRLRYVLLARRRHHRLLADARNRNLQARLAPARDLQRRTWLAQTAAASAPPRSPGQEEDQVCFLVHRILHGRGLGAIHRQHDDEQCHRGVRDERQHYRLACLAR